MDHKAAPLRLSLGTHRELVEGPGGQLVGLLGRVPTWSDAGLGYDPSLPQVDPYLPYEYTCAGMLERINAYIQHQVGHPVPCAPGKLGAVTPKPITSELGPCWCWGLCRLQQLQASHPSFQLCTPQWGLGPGVRQSWVSVLPLPHGPGKHRS